MRTLWDPILFTNHFDFKIQVKNLLADLSFGIYVETMSPCPSQGCRPVIGYRGAVKLVGGIIR